MNCGDVIIAAASTAYSASDFGYGKWGTVNCPAGNNVAWLKCAIFDACKIAAPTSDAMHIDASYWGVQGWEVTNGGGSNACFAATPNSSTSIHHVIFANDIASNCGSGFTAHYNGGGSASVDYIVYVGNIAYNASTDSGVCASGLSIWEPQNHDTAAGTHIYVAGNFSYKNFDPSPCAGGTPSDGEGIIIDTPDGSQSGLPQYTQQIVVHNNMVIGNGGRGIQASNNTAGSAHAPIFIEYNTSYGNNADNTNQNTGGSCGDIRLLNTLNTQALHNLSQTAAATGCGGYGLYAYYLATGGNSDVIDFDWGASASGLTCGIQSPANGFACGIHNTFGTSAGFASTAIPGAPSCGSATSVPNCMAAMITNFTPTTAAARAYGYQIPTTSPNSDPLFPQWLCNVNLPPGLVTTACGAASSSLPAPPTNIGVSIQ